MKSSDKIAQQSNTFTTTLQRERMISRFFFSPVLYFGDALNISEKPRTGRQPVSGPWFAIEGENGGVTSVVSQNQCLSPVLYSLGISNIVLNV